MSKKIFEKLKISTAGLFRYLFLLAALLLAVSLLGSIFKFVSASNRLKEMEEKLEKIKLESQKLQSEVEKVSTQAYIEKAARDKLGLAYEGETVVVLPDDEALRFLAPKISKSEQQTLPEPNWKKWIQLFIY